MVDRVRRDIQMSTSQQFDGRWLVYYVQSGRVDIHGIESEEQAIAYITAKPPGEFARFVYAGTNQHPGSGD